MREKLERNYQLNLQNNNLQKNFIIDSFVGEGASCLVYDAKYIDELGIIRNVRIKELYPLKTCDSVRIEKNIIWESDEKKNYYISQFENLYRRQIHFQNMTNYTNSSTQIIDNIYDANNTKYIILDCANGKTFDKYQPNHLQDIFEVLLSLTKLVKKYHEHGYLMLDIKPENFLTIDETNQLIKYLDFDSILSLYIIKNNKMNNLSCSIRYAAPELLKGDITKIDKCSDIYAIGAILYKKIFNLDVTANERSIGFNPNYDNKYFININPKIYKKLTTFFRKTLCNNPKRRYQDCDEVIIALEELSTISNPNALSLVSSSIIQNNTFIGRNKECLEIDQAFKNGKKIVFINGYGGIGKTELVKYYANSRKNNYHTIIFGKCSNGLKEVFENEDVFTIQNLRKEDVSLEERIQCIKQLVDEKTLLIIDNLDGLNDPYFEQLCSFDCKILITTRAYLDGIICNTDTTHILQLESMNLDDAYQLFTTYYKRNIDDEEKKCIYEIIKYIEGFSLMIPILAKQMMLESIYPSSMLNKLRNTKLKGISDSLIKHYKDNRIIHANAYDQALSLFDVFSLSNEEKEILYILSLLGNISISKRTLAVFAGQFDITEFNIDRIKDDFVNEIERLKETTKLRTINSLIEKGYLEYDQVYDLVRCHNIIREISLYEFNLSINDTTIFKDLLSIIINELRDDYIKKQQLETGFLFVKENKFLDSVYENELKQLCFNIFDNVDFSKNKEIITKSLLKHILVSEKDYSNIIKKYQNQTNELNIKFILLCSEWMQDLCLHKSGDYLIKKLDEISKYSSIDNEMYMENIKLLLKEIAILPYFHFLDTRLLSSLHDLCSKYLEEKYGYIPHNHKLLKEIEYAIENNCHEDVIFNDLSIDSIQFKIDSEPLEEKEVVDFKNIYSIYDHDYHIEYERSLHEASDYFNKDIKNIELKETKNDIEIPICLSLIKRYSVCDIIENDQFVTYFNSSSALSQINENKYEYLARRNDYMFMLLQLKQFNILKNINKIDAREYVLHSYQLNTSVGKLLAQQGEPSILLETLRIYINNIISKENLDYDKYNDAFYIFSSTKNHAINHFYNNCIKIGNKYHDSKLLQLVEKSKRDIIGIDISYHDPELSTNKSLDSEIMWNRIEELFTKIKDAVSIEEINDLRDEIMMEPNITVFFKNKLLNCINPKISFFDAILFDEGYMCKKYTCDIHLLEELLEKEKNDSFEGIEEIIHLLEICLQYILLENNDKIYEYIFKINKYISNHIMINNRFDYLLFKLIFEFIKINRKLKKDSYCKSLVIELYDQYVRFENEKSKLDSECTKSLVKIDYSDLFNFEKLETIDAYKKNMEFEHLNRHVERVIRDDINKLMWLCDCYDREDHDGEKSEYDLDNEWLKILKLLRSF